MYEDYIYSKTHLIFEMQMKENEGKSLIYRPIIYIKSPSYVYIQKNFQFYRTMNMISL